MGKLASVRMGKLANEQIYEIMRECFDHQPIGKIFILQE